MLWLTSEQMSFSLATGGAEKDLESGEESNQSSVPKVKSHPIAHHLASIITKFMLDEKRRCCDNKLEQTLALLHSEWSREVEPVKERTQSLIRRSVTVSDPIDKNGASFKVETQRYEVDNIIETDSC